MGFRCARSAGQSLAFALSTSLQTGNRNDAGAVSKGSSGPEGGETPAHNVSDDQADTRTRKLRFECSLRARFSEALRNDTNSLSPPQWPHCTAASPSKKETFSQSGQNLAVFDNKQSLTTLCIKLRLPSTHRTDKSLNGVLKKCFSSPHEECVC